MLQKSTASFFNPLSLYLSLSLSLIPLWIFGQSGLGGVGASVFAHRGIYEHYYIWGKSLGWVR